MENKNQTFLISIGLGLAILLTIYAFKEYAQRSCCGGLRDASPYMSNQTK